VFGYEVITKFIICRSDRKQAGKPAKARITILIETWQKVNAGLIVFRWAREHYRANYRENEHLSATKKELSKTVAYPYSAHYPHRGAGNGKRARSSTVVDERYR
jgi:hypothetical protein